MNTYANRLFIAKKISFQALLMRKKDKNKSVNLILKSAIIKPRFFVLILINDLNFNDNFIYLK